MFVKTNDTAKIKTLPQWTEAFHVFVAIYCQKHPENVGHLMTYAQIVQGKAKFGRTFLRRIIDLTIGLSKPYHHRRLNKESRADLQAWSIFLENFNGRALFHSGITHTS